MAVLGAPRRRRRVARGGPRPRKLREREAHPDALLRGNLELTEQLLLLDRERGARAAAPAAPSIARPA